MARFIRSTVIALLSSAVAGHGGIWNYSIAGDWRPGYIIHTGTQTGHFDKNLN